MSYSILYEVEEFLNRKPNGITYLLGRVMSYEDRSGANAPCGIIRAVRVDRTVRGVEKRLDPEEREVFTELLPRVDGYQGCHLHILSFNLEPEDRANGLALDVVRRTMKVWSVGCDCATAKIHHDPRHAFQGTDQEIQAYWRRLGFNRYRQTPYVGRIL